MIWYFNMIPKYIKITLKENSEFVVLFSSDVNLAILGWPSMIRSFRSHLGLLLTLVQYYTSVCQWQYWKVWFNEAPVSIYHKATVVAVHSVCLQWRKPSEINTLVVLVAY